VSESLGFIYRLPEQNHSSVDTSLSGEWMVYRHFSTQCEQYTLNFQVTLLFHKLEF
jgi:hypothetical protein